MEDTRDDAFILEVRSALGSNIARLRMERGMSQAEPARIAGVDRSRLCRLESGKVTVKKGLKKGSYKVTVKVKAAGNANYKASAWKTVKFTVKVK